MSLDEMITIVMREQYEADQKGVTSIWTIYKCPTDWPQGYIARRHNCDKNGSRPTNSTLVGQAADDATLQFLRTVFVGAGLFCLPRDDTDEPAIVESWV